MSDDKNKNRSQPEAYPKPSVNDLQVDMQPEFIDDEAEDPKEESEAYERMKEKK